MLISINYVRIVMCYKFYYIILYGNNILKLLSMYIIYDCEIKFNIEVKENKILNIWIVWCSWCIFFLKKKLKESDFEYVYIYKKINYVILK